MSQLQTGAHFSRCPQWLRKCMSQPEHTCKYFLQPTLTLNDRKAKVWGLRSQATVATSWGGMQPQFSVSRGSGDSAQLRLQTLLGYAISLFVKHKHSILLNLSVGYYNSGPCYILHSVSNQGHYCSLESYFIMSPILDLEFRFEVLCSVTQPCKLDWFWDYPIRINFSASTNWSFGLHSTPTP